MFLIFPRRGRPGGDGIGTVVSAILTLRRLLSCVKILLMLPGGKAKVTLLLEQCSRCLLNTIRDGVYQEEVAVIEACQSLHQDAKANCSGSSSLYIEYSDVLKLDPNAPLTAGMLNGRSAIGRAPLTGPTAILGMIKVLADRRQVVGGCRTESRVPSHSPRPSRGAHPGSAPIQWRLQRAVATHSVALAPFWPGAELRARALGAGYGEYLILRSRRVGETTACFTVLFQSHVSEQWCQGRQG